jgi:hypothetical protein
MTWLTGPPINAFWRFAGSISLSLFNHLNTAPANHLPVGAYYVIKVFSVLKLFLNK